MDINDSLVKLFLDQTMGQHHWSQQNYERVSSRLGEHSQEEQAGLLNYLKQHPLPYGASLGELFHKEAVWRNIDYYKSKKRVPLTHKEPYSVDMLMNL